jgi:DNA modification methylase
MFLQTKSQACWKNSTSVCHDLARCSRCDHKLTRCRRRFHNRHPDRVAVEVNRTLIGDCRLILPQLIAQGVRVNCVVTSPPYWGLRDYGVSDQIGLEPTLDGYVQTMVEVFRVVRELLADDGTVWLNLGDSYSSGSRTMQIASDYTGRTKVSVRPPVVDDLKPKDLCGVPWRVAFALQADGWYLRQDIIWAKPNPMPESVSDRCTKAHEYVFLLAKRSNYYFDQEAIREPHSREWWDEHVGPEYMTAQDGRNDGGKRKGNGTQTGRNRRSVWTIPSEPFPDAHFATFPQALVEPCMMAGSRPGDIVLDPFMGSGTVAQVAQRLGRRWIGIELNPAYAPMVDARTRQLAFDLAPREADVPEPETLPLPLT